MSDATGHMDRPGAGPLNSASIAFCGILTNHYSFENPETGLFEIVKGMPSGTRDQVIKIFSSRPDLENWARSEFDAGRLV